MSNTRKALAAIPDTTELTNAQLLEMVDGWVNGGIEAGAAMQLLHDRGVHREAGVTWEDFAYDRWNISRGYSYQLMDAARIVEACRRAGIPAPTNESQTRILGAIPESNWPAVMQQVYDVTDGKPTAKAIQAAAGTAEDGSEVDQELVRADEQQQDEPEQPDQAGGADEDEQHDDDTEDEPEVDLRHAAHYVITKLDRAYSSHRSIRTLADNYSHPHVAIHDPLTLINQVIAGLGDQVIVDDGKVWLAEPMNHDHELSDPPGLLFGGEFIRSEYHTGDSRDDTSADAADALKQELQKHAIAADYLVNSYYADGKPRPELMAGRRDKYLSKRDDQSRTKYARLLQTLADAGRLKGDAEIGYLPQPLDYLPQPEDELEAVDRELDELVYRLGVLQGRVEAAEAAKLGLIRTF